MNKPYRLVLAEEATIQSCIVVFVDGYRTSLSLLGFDREHVAEGYAIHIDGRIVDTVLLDPQGHMSKGGCFLYARDHRLAVLPKRQDH